jgi:hypothetical protein
MPGYLLSVFTTHKTQTQTQTQVSAAEDLQGLIFELQQPSIVHNFAAMTQTVNSSIKSYETKTHQQERALQQLHHEVGLLLRELEDEYYSSPYW